MAPHIDGLVVQGEEGLEDGLNGAVVNSVPSCYILVVNHVCWSFVIVANKCLESLLCHFHLVQNVALFAVRT